MRKPILVGIVVLALLILGGLVFYFNPSRKNQKSMPIVPQTEDKLLGKMVKWEDQLGFSFEYPEGVEVNKHDEDQENYAHVELTHKDHPGNLVIWAKDLPLNSRRVAISDLVEWVASDKRLTGASILDTTLDTQPAKKTLLTTPAKMSILGAIYDGLLYTVETNLTDSEYWSKVQNRVVASFIFDTTKKPAVTKEKQVFQDTGGSVDEEEVVE